LFFISKKNIFFFYKTSYLSEELNSTESPLVSIPWLGCPTKVFSGHLTIKLFKTAKRVLCEANKRQIKTAKPDHEIGEFLHSFVQPKCTNTGLFVGGMMYTYI
jgi:hypothetical protein